MSQVYNLPAGSTSVQVNILTNVSNDLEALRSSFSGVNPPTNPPPLDGQLFRNESTKVIYAYNDSTMAWDTLSSVSGGSGGGGGSNWTVSGADIYNSNVGNVGIGTSTPSAKVAIYQTQTVPTQKALSISNYINPSTQYTGGGQWALRVDNYLQGGSGATANLPAIRGWSETETSSSANWSYLRAVEGSLSHKGTGTINESVGVYGLSRNDSATGTITTAHGVRGQIWNQSTGTIGTAYAVHAVIDGNSGGGTITNAYGVYIGTILGTNKWGLYSATTEKSYFAGRVGVGTPTPEAPLHVAKGSSGAPTDPNSVLVIESNTWTALEIKAPSDKTSEIFFTDTDYINGAISYDHPNETLFFNVNRVFAVEIVGNGISSKSNVGLFATGSYGGGKGVLGVANAATVPASNPTGGGILYSEGGAGKWRGSSGTVTTFGPAEPHCPDCGRDFVLEWENHQTGSLTICMWCVTDGMTKGIMRRSDDSDS